MNPQVWTTTHNLRRIKRITTHAGHARLLAELGDPIGTIPRVKEIPSPYAYAPDHTVYGYLGTGRVVIIVETAHKRFDVYEVESGAVAPLQKED